MPFLNTTLINCRIGLEGYELPFSELGSFVEPGEAGLRFKLLVANKHTISESFGRFLALPHRHGCASCSIVWGSQSVGRVPAGCSRSVPQQTRQTRQRVPQQTRGLRGRRVGGGRGGRRRHAPGQHVLAPRGQRRAHHEQHAPLPCCTQRRQHLHTPTG